MGEGLGDLGPVRSMSKPREVEGVWWFPPEQGKRWIGTLRLELGASSSLALKSIDGLSADVSFPEQPLVVQGETVGGLVTLLHAMKEGGRFSGTISTIEYSVGIAVLGLHLASREAFLVNQMDLSVQNLHEWFSHSGFLDGGFEAGEMLIRHRLPELTKCNLNDDVEMALVAHVSLGDRARERRISENTTWSFCSKAGFSLGECMRLQSAVRQLLHFALLRPIHLCKIVTRREGVGQQVGDAFVPREIEVWTENLKADDRPEVLRDLWVFQFADLGEDFGGAFSRWLTFCDEFNEALGCYNGTVYHRLPPEIRFLSIAQALEAFYSIRHNAHKNAKFETKILAALTPVASLLSSRISSPQAYAEAVKATRNYYTHHNPIWLNTGLVARSADLLRMIEVLQIAFQVGVLNELGIPPTRFQRLLRQLSSTILSYE